MSELGRVADPQALTDANLVTGRIRVSVPETWAGAELEIVLPRLIQCASCEGGGCDRCARSGAHRSSGQDAVTVHLPAQLAGGIVLRVPDPLGSPDTGALLLEVLLIEVLPGPVATRGCKRLEPLGESGANTAAKPQRNLLLLVLLAIALSILLALALRR